MPQIFSLILGVTLTSLTLRIASAQEHYQPVPSRGQPCQWNIDCEWGQLCRLSRIDGPTLCLTSEVPIGDPCFSHLECSAYKSICNATGFCDCPSNHENWQYECVPRLVEPVKSYDINVLPENYGIKCYDDFGFCKTFGLECESMYSSGGNYRCVKPAGLNDFCYTDMDCFAKNPGSECVSLTSSTQLQCACKKGFVPFGKGCTAAGQHIGRILLIWGGTIVALATLGSIFLLIVGLALLCKGWCCCIKDAPTHPKVSSVGQLMKNIRWTRPSYDHYYRPLPDGSDTDPTPSTGIGIFYQDPETSNDTAGEFANSLEPRIRYSRAPVTRPHPHLNEYQF